MVQRASLACLPNQLASYLATLRSVLVQLGFLWLASNFLVSVSALPRLKSPKSSPNPPPSTLPQPPPPPPRPLPHTGASTLSCSEKPSSNFLALSITSAAANHLEARHGTARSSRDPPWFLAFACDTPMQKHVHILILYIYIYMCVCVCVHMRNSI